MENKKTKEEIIKTVLRNVGFGLAFVTAIAYLVIVYVLIKGFHNSLESQKLLIFLVIGAIAGIAIVMSLRIQGIDLAKENKSAIKVLKEYTDLISKDETVKLRSINYHIYISLLKDILIKGVTIVVSLYFAIEIIINGMNDEKYFFLAVANVFMFIGFGMLALAKAYDYYIDIHIPYLEKKINKMKGEEDGKLKEQNSRETPNIGECGRSEGTDRVDQGLGASGITTSRTDPKTPNAEEGLYRSSQDDSDTGRSNA